MLLSGLQKDLGSEDIGPKKNLRVADGAIHVGLCSEVENCINRTASVEIFKDGVAIGDVEPGVVMALSLFLGQVGQIIGVSSIGNQVPVEDRPSGSFCEEEPDEITSNKSQTTGNNDSHDVLRESGEGQGQGFRGGT